MLTEFGFGLDLDQCAATGATADLIYVSPEIRPRGVAQRGRRVAGPHAAAAGFLRGESRASRQRMS
jgi:DNA repair protein RecO (recombination protein O)